MVSSWPSMEARLVRYSAAAFWMVASSDSASLSSERVFSRLFSSVSFLCVNSPQLLSASSFRPSNSFLSSATLAALALALSNLRMALCKFLLGATEATAAASRILSYFTSCSSVKEAMPPDSDCLSSSYSFWSAVSFSWCSVISSSNSASLEVCAAFSFSIRVTALASAVKRFLRAEMASEDSMTEGCSLSTSASSLIRSLSLAVDSLRALEASFFASFKRPSFSSTTFWCSARDSCSSVTDASRCWTSE
mmetsp:Transcript_34263/g.72157  ORF Transcript_34263/g.72157 Transcript_34263/m.72157 type:complete len:250 (-) Transcript_34263:1211-1960(-)